jgi:class 3 adenylate cyclase
MGSNDESGNSESQISGLKSRMPDSSLTPTLSTVGRGRTLLNSLLSELNQYPERITEITEQLRKAFERRVAILALDMVGFSRLTLEYGIVHYIAMIHQMVEAATPAVTDNAGQIIKQDADNLFAIFDAPEQAVEAALDIFRSFDAINLVVPPERNIYSSIGIGYGETLIIDEQDMFGAEMNIACKLGEDLAENSEILITPAAYAALPANRYPCAPVKYSLDHLEINCYRYERSLNR